MTLKRRTRTLLLLGLLLATTPLLLYHSPRGSEKVAGDLAAPAAAPTAAVTLSAGAPTGARQEKAQTGKGAQKNSAADEAAARDRDVRRGLVRLNGEVPQALAVAEKRQAKAADDEPLALTIVLRRDDQQGFDEFLRGVQDPQSPTYRHYLSPREQAERFGPSQGEYDEVEAWLRRKGFTLVEGSANRLTLTVRGTRRRAQQAFGV